ncbi:MAG: twin-arginine translocation signal domain-containing protein [Acetobacteraceae bacterium]|nr:twin-arginine translocation signal domain-containing protein [Acetobacteraceae bacterium]
MKRRTILQGSGVTGAALAAPHFPARYRRSRRQLAWPTSTAFEDFRS